MEQTTSNIEIEAIHQIQTSLHEFRDALPIALYYLQQGERPAAIPDGDAKSIRFMLHPKSVHLCERLIPEFGSRTKVITAALAWVAEKNKTQQYLFKHTKLYY